MSDTSAIAARLTQAFNGHDPAAVGQALLCGSDHAACRAPRSLSLGERPSQNMLAGYFRAFPDLKLEVPVVICSGDHIVCEGTLAGTNTGPAGVCRQGMCLRLGAASSVPLAFVLTVGSDGLVHEDHTYFDEASFLRQLGLLALRTNTNSPFAHKAAVSA